VPHGLRTEGVLVHACKSMQVMEILGLLGNDASSQAVISLEMYQFLPGLFRTGKFRKKTQTNHKTKACPASPAVDAAGGSMLTQCHVLLKNLPFPLRAFIFRSLLFFCKIRPK